MLLTVEPHDVLPGVEAVLAGMGARSAAGGRAVSPGDAAVRGTVEQGLEAALALMCPRAAWVVRPVAPMGGEVSLPARSRAEVPLRWRAGAAAARLAGAGRVALVLATLGPDLEEEAAASFQRGDYLRGLVLDVVGGIAVHRLAGRARSQVSREARVEGFTVGPPTGPGYDGWPLEDLPALVLAAGGPMLGVSLTAGLMLSPQKSLCLVMPWIHPERRAGRVAPAGVAAFETGAGP